MFNFFKKKEDKTSGGNKTSREKSAGSILDTIAAELKKIGVDPSANAGVGVLEYPKNIENGDISFFVKDQRLDPAKLPLEKIEHEYIEKLSVVGRFINFRLSQKYFVDTLKQATNDPANFARNRNLADQKIIVEYTDPNPFKEFHIGHLMSNTIGESIARIFEWSGATVTRANYQGDVGPHVAKAIWGMMQTRREQPKENEPNGKKISFLGRAYVLGSQAYENAAGAVGAAGATENPAHVQPEAKREIDAINRKIYEKSDLEINSLYKWGREASLVHFEEIYKKLGTKFDLYFFESETAPLGIFLVKELIQKGVLEKSDGAIVFKGEKYGDEKDGLHTRVFVNSQGLPTYETKELGLAKAKFDRADFDKSVVITGNEQTDYYKVFLKVLGFVDHRAANRTRHIGHGMLRFAEGKMSSRKGNVITGEALLADVEKLVEEKIKDRGFGAAEKSEVTEQVAVGAIKYSILKQSPGRDIIFDFSKSLSFEGDSGPYLQYTHARICSVLNKAAEQKIRGSFGGAFERAANSKNPEIPGTLERLLVRMPEVVERAQKELAPQLILTFLTNLASAFNHYYAQNVIVEKAGAGQNASGGSATSAYRVALTQTVKIALENGLYLLGIQAPERM